MAAIFSHDIEIVIIHVHVHIQHCYTISLVYVVHQGETFMKYANLTKQRLR